MLSLRNPKLAAKSWKHSRILTSYLSQLRAGSESGVHLRGTGFKMLSLPELKLVIKSRKNLGICSCVLQLRAGRCGRCLVKGVKVNELHVARRCAGNITQNLQYLYFQEANSDVLPFFSRSFGSLFPRAMSLFQLSI